MKTNPKISIIMPAYNAAKYIGAALNSLLIQTYENWECIVVNDGSNDDTLTIIKNYIGKDKRIILVDFKENKGRPAARQAALDRCDGKYIAMLDADDIYFPEKLQLQVEYLEENIDVGAISSTMIRFNDDHLSSKWQKVTAEVESFTQISGFTSNILPHAPTMFNRELAKGFAFDARLKRAQDLDFILYLANRTNFALIKKPLYGYRMNKNTSKKVILEGLRYQRIVINKWAKQKTFLQIAINYIKVILISISYKFYLKISPLSEELLEQKRIKEYLAELHK